MGYFKERLSTTITADLKQWRLSVCGNHVTGIIFNTTNEKEYPEGEKFTIMNISLSFYQWSSELGQAHMVAKSPMGTYFRMNLEDYEK